MMPTACVMTRTTAVIDTSCSAFRQISFYCPKPENKDNELISCGAGDTAQTVIEIREHNAVYNQLCNNELGK